MESEDLLLGSSLLAETNGSTRIWLLLTRTTICSIWPYKNRLCHSHCAAKMLAAKKQKHKDGYNGAFPNACNDECHAQSSDDSDGEPVQNLDPKFDYTWHGCGGGSADDPKQFESIVQEYGAQQLHDELSKRRLNTSGRRPERVQRLVHAMVCDLTSNDQSPLGVDDLSTCSYHDHSVAIWVWSRMVTLMWNLTIRVRSRMVTLMVPRWRG